MTRALCVTRPSSEYRSAPNACPPSVEHALAMPTITLLPVTFPSVVARAAPARGRDPRWPTKATDVRLMTRLHIMLRLTGRASRSCATPSPKKPPSAADASAFSARDSGGEEAASRAEASSSPSRPTRAYPARFRHHPDIARPRKPSPASPFSPRGGGVVTWPPGALILRQCLRGAAGRRHYRLCRVYF